MLKHPELTKKRFDRFLGELRTFLYPQSAPLTALSVYSAPSRITYGKAINGKYRPTKEGELLGPHWSTHWFRLDYAIPRSWRNEEVLLHFKSSSEGCVWQDGVPV